MEMKTRCQKACGLALFGKVKHNEFGPGGAVVETMPVRRAALLAFLLGVTVLLYRPVGADAGGVEKAHNPGRLEILKRIYQEVKELGPFPGQHFIRWDFFIGEGDDDTYKPIHAIVLIQTMRDGEGMIVQVSRMEASPINPRVFWNQGTREVSSRVRGGQVEIVSSDYSDQDLDRFLPTLLLSIRDKKKLIGNW